MFGLHKSVIHRDLRLQQALSGVLSSVLVALLLFTTPTTVVAAEASSVTTTSQPVASTNANNQDEPTTERPPVSGPEANKPGTSVQSPGLTGSAEKSPVAADPMPLEQSPDAAAPQSASQPAATQTANSSVTIDNTIDSSAQSGNAAVTDSKNAGNAASGTATTGATIVNVVGYSNGLGNGAPATTFVQNVYNSPGSNEIQGSIVINPHNLGTNDSTSTERVWYSPYNSGESVTQITNNVTLNATSGNADVLSNERAGNASTGDATAMANIINVVNSSVGARNTFLGVVNIHGNLRGDILVPSTLVDSLFGSNSVSPTAIPSTTLHDNIDITNTINLSATSGDATVADNGQAGDATTGNASTKLTVFNLTGQEVVAANSLLVFVNVMGKWVGMIMNAPEGSTAAAFSGGSSTVGESSGESAAVTDQTAIQAASKVSITNNINVSATSGDATVADNGQAGSATSGNATAGASVLNLVHSSFSLNDWFGVLFINVLGSWLGNFGIAPQPSNSESATQPTNGVQAVRVFRLNQASKVTTPSATTDTTQQPAVELASANSAPDIPVSSGNVLGTSDSTDSHVQQQQLSETKARSQTALIATTLFVLVLVALAVTLAVKLGRGTVHNR